ncbi:MAG: hypothetical protein ACI8Y4_001066 [Candidatus Poriferisodalaceae bacterium]
MKRALALVAAAVFGAGCGISTDTSIGSIEPPADFFKTDLVDPIDASRCGNVGFTQHPIWVFEGDQIVELRRCLQAPAFLGDVMNTLIIGVTDDEANSGLVSAISPGTAVRTIRLEDQGIVVVELSDSFYDNIQGELRIRATAQVVLTALDLASSTDAVRFERNGVVQFLPNDAGDVNASLLRASDFTRYIAPIEPAASALFPPPNPPTSALTQSKP